MEKKVNTNKVRLGVLDILTGFATLLVVSGHHRFLEEYALWYDIYGGIVYSFHMALFMLVSGFLIQYSYPTASVSYVQYVGRKLKKFLPAYFAVGIIASIVASSSVAEFVRNILLLFYDPVNGSIQIIWYIYVLMLFYALMPFIMRLSVRCLLALLPIALFLSIVSSTFNSIFCIRSASYLFFFFLLGVLSCRYYERILRVRLIYWFLLGIPFVIYIVFFIYLQHNPFVFVGGRTLSSIMALPLCLWLGFSLDRTKSKFINQTSNILSRHAFSIYLWQMFVINALWLVFNRISTSPLTPSTTFIYLVLSTILTIVATILVDMSYKKSMRWIQNFKNRYY